LGKQKRLRNIIGLSRIWRVRTTRCGFGRAKDECGTMRDETQERRKPEEGGRGRRREQVRFGTRAGMSRKTKEMPVYDRSIKIFTVCRTKEGGGLVRNWD
jgi:hypothetical protein